MVSSPFSLRREFHLHEAHISTEQRETQEDARLSFAYGDADRTQRDQAQAGQGAKTIDRRRAAEAGALLIKREALSRGRESFPKTVRLTKRSEFLSLSRGGRRIHSPHFLLIRKANNKGKSRLGITVSAKVGKAVIRNRIKRLVREFFRRHRGEISSSQDIIVIARPGSDRLSLETVSKELGEIFVHGEKLRS